MEEKLNADPELRELFKEIEALELKCETLRNELWELRVTKGIDGSSSEGEEKLGVHMEI